MNELITVLGSSLGLALGFLITSSLIARRRRQRISTSQWRSLLRSHGIGTKEWTGWK